MRIALEAADIPVQTIANQLEVSRATVSDWLNGHRIPKPATLMAWAHLTGVPVEWLRSGSEDSGSPDFYLAGGAGGSREGRGDAQGDDEVRPEGFEPPTFCSVVTRSDYALAA